MFYKAIIFDLDGTLIDSMQLWRQVDEEFLAKRGIEVPADLFDSLPGGNSFIQTAQYFIDRFGLQDSVQSIMEEWTRMVFEHYRSGVLLKPGAGELVRDLSNAGIPIGLATSNSYQLAKTVLSAHGIWSFFSAVMSGDMEVKGKPHPDLFLKCADALDFLPAQCLAIEDTLSGVTAATNAGMRVFAIYDEDSAPQWKEIKALAYRSFESYEPLSLEVKKALGFSKRR